MGQELLSLDRVPDKNSFIPVDIQIVNNPDGFAKGVRILQVGLKDGDPITSIPVYNCRLDSHHEFIANHMANHESVVAFGVGLYGLGALVHDPRVEKYKESYLAFFRAKSGRTELDRIPLQTPPKYLLDYMDIEKVHPDFRRYFDTREAREDFWKISIAIHVLGPLKDNPRIHEIFSTPPDLWPKKNVPTDQWRNVSTASFFWWHDPDWNNIANIIELKNPDAVMGISSFNEHGELPAWTFEDVVKFVKNKRITPFEAVITDPIGESVEVNSSFAQIQVPLLGEKPEWVVYREGPSDLDVLMDRLSNRFGVKHKYRLVDGVRFASRGHDKNVDLQGKMELVQHFVQEDWKRRHPQPKNKIGKFTQGLFS